MMTKGSIEIFIKNYLKNNCENSKDFKVYHMFNGLEIVHKNVRSYRLTFISVDRDRIPYNQFLNVGNEYKIICFRNDRDSHIKERIEQVLQVVIG